MAVIDSDHKAANQGDKLRCQVSFVLCERNRDPLDFGHLFSLYAPVDLKLCADGLSGV